MHHLTFRIVHFTNVDKYVGIAWDYDNAIIVTTVPFPTYTAARGNLEKKCTDLCHTLKWFDGEYTCSGNGDFISLAELKKD